MLVNGVGRMLRGFGSVRVVGSSAERWWITYKRLLALELRLVRCCSGLPVMDEEGPF